MPRFMEIDFLIAEYQGFAQTVESGFAHTEDLRIKLTSGGNVTYRQNDMVDSVKADLGRHGQYRAGYIGLLISYSTVDEIVQFGPQTKW